MLLFIMLTKIPKMIIHVLASMWGSALTQAAAKSHQPCPTLCDPTDGGPPGSPVPGILQARTLEWVAISFSSARKWKVKVTSLSRFQLLATPWTAAHQAPPSMGISRQEHWSGCHYLLRWHRLSGVKKCMIEGNIKNSQLFLTEKFCF